MTGPINQTRLTATSPDAEGEPVTVTILVDTTRLEAAGPESWQDLQTLMTGATRRRGGTPHLIEWTAEPVGPRLQLVAVDGALL